jgi:hypothetical protein
MSTQPRARNGQFATVTRADPDVTLDGDADLWAARGVAPEVAQQWASIGHTPVSAGPWLRRKFTPVESLEWAANGYRASEAAPWHSAGFCAADAFTYETYGFTPQTAKDWRAAGHPDPRIRRDPGAEPNRRPNLIAARRDDPYDFEFEPPDDPPVDELGDPWQVST